MARINFKGEVIDATPQFSAEVVTALHAMGIRAGWFWEIHDVLEALEEVGLEPSEDAAEVFFAFHAKDIQEQMRIRGREVILNLLYRAKTKGVID